MNIVIGGAAGQGMDTIAHLLGKALTREGYAILTAKDYMSRVRGGHNFTRLRVGPETPWAPAGDTDLLIALNEETYHLHHKSLSDTGRVIYDPDLFTPVLNPDRQAPVQLQALAKKAGSVIMANTVAVGAALSLLGISPLLAEKLLAEAYKKEVAAQNITALWQGYNEMQKVCGGSCFALPDPKPGERLFLDGNQTLGLASLVSGCRFIAAYPMTPATGVMTYLAGKQDSHDILVEQAEDEIAAINMALGASFAGVRSMTCTSGGGFALMAEGLSLAGMTETPIVILLAMRPGPATGFPTRTEQGDLEFALYAGHGEFPRAILSATYHEDAFYRLNKAFDLADKYQIPVIVLSDQSFADTARTISPFDFKKLRYNRHIVDATSLERPYKRYCYTDSGISPRAIPGFFAGETVLADSDEHDEKGNITEDAATRRLMTDKRLRKLDLMAKEMDEPILYGNHFGDLLLIGWGSVYGALREATDILNSMGVKTALMHFTDLWPLPRLTAHRLFPQFKKTICVEQNATAQFKKLLFKETGLVADHAVLKYDGRQFLAAEIVREVAQYV